jgi:chromosome segregation ATPase
LPTLSAATQEPVVQSAFDAFLEEQTQKVRLKLEAEFEEKIASLEQSRDEALNRADELARQQLTLKTLLDRKQSEIAGFNVSAKAQADKAQSLYQENARLSLELAALNKKLESYDEANKKKWADEQAILYAQLNSAEHKARLMEESFTKEQQAHTTTRDKLITLNEKQRLDAMGERVNLEDKLSKQQARFSASQARLKEEHTSLLSKLKGVEAHCEYLTGLVTQTQEKAVAERQALFELQQRTDEKRQKALVKTLNQHQKVLKDNQYDNFEYINNKNRDVSIAVNSLKREVSDKMSVLQQTLFSHTQESTLNKKQLGEFSTLLQQLLDKE